MAADLRMDVREEMDAIHAVLQTVEQAKQIGFDDIAATMIGTAASELARNLLNHAGKGELRVRAVEEYGRSGIEIEARDQGPGIPDIEKAMSDHFSTAGTLGLGLPGVKRLMDDLRVESAVGSGTCVTTRKYR